MRKIRAVKCTECDHTESRFTNDDDKVIDCNKCKSIAAKVLLCTPAYFGNSTGRSPSAVN